MKREEGESSLEKDSAAPRHRFDFLRPRNFLEEPESRLRTKSCRSRAQEILEQQNGSPLNLRVPGALSIVDLSLLLQWLLSDCREISLQREIDEEQLKRSVALEEAKRPATEMERQRVSSRLNSLEEKRQRRKERGKRKPTFSSLSSDTAA